MNPAPFLAAACVCWTVVPLLSSLSGRHVNSRWRSLIIGVGAALLLIGSSLGIAGSAGRWSAPLPIWFGVAGAAFRIDPLSAYFLIVLAVVAIPTAIYTPAYMDHLRNRVDMRLFWAGVPILLLSMMIVILAANVLSFLIAWELMSLSSFGLVATDHKPHSTQRAALLYLGATRLGTGFLAAGFLWAHALSHTWSFQGWHFAGSSALGPGLLILVGLGVKAGMWPFHLWLPAAHPAAPAPISALMSGVMVKVAVYMMVRLFLLNPAFVNPAFGYLFLATGAIGAFWGILFALLQQDLKRILAYSTVENVGLILIGVGAAIVAAQLGLPAAAAIAAGAALFHVMNHALFKSLLFFGAGAVDASSHTRDLDLLGGLGRRMPWTFGFFTLGAACISALPPLNGFASEWLLYEGTLRIAWSHAAPVFRFSALLAVGWLALVGVLAVACFTRAIGVVFQGRARSKAAEHAMEAPASMIAAQGILAGICVLLGVGAPYALRILQPLVSDLNPAGPALAQSWTLPTTALIPVTAATLAAGALWLWSSKLRGWPRTYVTWECGFGGLTPRMQVAANSFTQPVSRMFGVLVRYAVQLRLEGPYWRLFPEEILVEQRTEAVLETRLYLPIVRGVRLAGGWLAKMQAGSIHLYLLTMFLTLLILLVIGGRHR